MNSLVIICPVPRKWSTRSVCIDGTLEAVQGDAARRRLIAFFADFVEGYRSF
jgi:hypothetical protein